MFNSPEERVIEDKEQIAYLNEWSRKQKEKQLSGSITFLDLFVCASLFLMFIALIQLLHFYKTW